jgi:hypothetical protein
VFWLKKLIIWHLSRFKYLFLSFNIIWRAYCFSFLLALISFEIEGICLSWYCLILHFKLGFLKNSFVQRSSFKFNLFMLLWRVFLFLILWEVKFFEWCEFFALNFRKFSHLRKYFFVKRFSFEGLSIFNCCINTFLKITSFLCCEFRRLRNCHSFNLIPTAWIKHRF